MIKKGGMPSVAEVEIVSLACYMNIRDSVLLLRVCYMCKIRTPIIVSHINMNG